MIGDCSRHFHKKHGPEVVLLCGAPFKSRPKQEVWTFLLAQSFRLFATNCCLGQLSVFFAYGLFCSIWVLSAISPNLQAKIPDQQCNRRKFPTNRRTFPTAAQTNLTAGVFRPKSIFSPQRPKNTYFLASAFFWTSGGGSGGVDKSAAAEKAPLPKADLLQFNLLVILLS